MADKRDLQNISMTEFTKLVPTQPVILDVREPALYEAGHIPGAINVPRASVEAGLYTPTEKTYVICEGGVDSVQAAIYLSEKGFDVVNVLGGMIFWRGPRKKGLTP
ncbi:rhodanese-like domain-containing protein [Agrilactobacillus yilanensis]|uniref:Rhodanese-like domain-containing protein n=1 Tax=Agrilactobacillus yilanensis TaxID=2485997 RepID=A0ABW4J7U4_9LACO|nr:rhodanese-like domain-containing protein [Agrilactobacillus yilanensis]